VPTKFAGVKELVYLLSLNLRAGAKIEGDMGALSFEEFAGFIRQWGRISPKKRIAPETDFEGDLGVSGDDGLDLLEAVEKRFGVSLSRESFNLAPDEFLFHGEGLWPDLGTLFGGPTLFVVGLTAGTLYNVVKGAVANAQKI